jgi:NitT/TauT family transport system ATP-binding protein
MTTTQSPLLKLEHIALAYPGGPRVLRDVNLSVEPGESLAVVGPSGCGKSTLMRIIAGFESATGGTLTVSGEPVTGPGPDRGVVFQDYGLFPWLSVQENIAYGPKQQRLGPTTVRDRARLFMEAVGLAKADVHVSARGASIRVAPHVYTTDADVARFREALAALL